MKEYKSRNFKLFYIIIWSIIFLFSLYLIFQCILVFGSESLSEDTQTFKTNIIATTCNYMMQSNIPILSYVSHQEKEGSSNIILNTLAGVFPINKYIADTEDSTEENPEEEAKNSLLFEKGYNLLFDNSSTYNDSNTSASDTGNSSQQSKEDETEVSSSTAQGSSSDDSIPIDIIKGDVYLEDEDSADSSNSMDSEETMGTLNGENFTLEQLENRQFLYKNFYIVDSSTVVTDSLFDPKVLLGKDMKIKANSDEPQILIYHTHSQESYADSKKGVEDDTVVGVGSYLTELLTDKYGFHVIHDTSKYDLMEGYLDRKLAYNYACDGVTKILEDNPSIEVVIDLHRDGVSEDLPAGQGKRLSNVKGKDIAQIMLFNGLSRNTKGEISWLENPYLQDNLAFSLQLQIKGRELYPGLMYKNYLKAYRYNAHLCKKSLLAEVGTNRNTVEEAKNSMEFFASVLYEELVGE